MRRIGMGGLLLSSLAVSVLAADPPSKGRAAALRTRPTIEEQLALRESADPDIASAAAVDTYTIVYYSFEPNSWQGWTRVDNTAQPDTFWHIEDYLEPELAGLPGPIEGTKSLWCGAPPGPASYMCAWRNAPGYGNLWDQCYGCRAFNIYGEVTFSYRIRTDLEPDRDFVRVYYYKSYNEDWIEIASYSGETDVAASHAVNSTLGTKFRFRFTSDAVGSDEDGLFDSNGAVHLDELTIRNWGEVVDYEDFETGTDGAQRCNSWGWWPATEIAWPFGRFSKLRANLQDIDPCNENMTTQIAFFAEGSCESSVDYPGLCSTPPCRPASSMGQWAVVPCQNEMAVSPFIDLTKYATAKNNVQDATIPAGDLANLGPAHLSFTVYKDLPPENLVFYTWRVRGVDASGCPRLWSAFMGGREPGERPGYQRLTFDVGAFSDYCNSIQVALGVVDMCDVWYGGAPCAEHTPAPWFDNVEIRRAVSPGPQWSYWAGNLFQDNFPENEYNYLASFVRADAAVDINPPGNPAIRPGDSIVVECRPARGGPLGLDPAGGPAVYLHVKCTGTGGAPIPPDLAGPALAGTYGSYKSDDGVWTIIQGDSARTSAGISPSAYMFDLNDSLFQRGHLVEYYFTARDAAGLESSLPRWARSYGPYFEFTCLPTLGSDILFVDDYDGIGCFRGAAEQYWMPTFDRVLLPPDDKVDKYDVNAPSSGVSNGPGSRAKNFQLTSAYNIIVWDSGDLSTCTISDGTSSSDKSNDCRTLVDWMSASDHGCGLWICGDDIAYELDRSTASSALALLSTWCCGVDFVATSYFDATGGSTSGGVVSPLVTGHIDAGIFVHGGVPDKFYAYGGCPIVNEFDCLEKTGTGKYALSYPTYLGTPFYAAIANQTTNAGDYPVRTMWFGFSYMYVRDDQRSCPMERYEIATDVFSWMQHATDREIPPDPTRTDVPSRYALAQNFPNPFNPSTTVRYDTKAKGLVTLRLYDVSGRLVRTLVDGIKDAGSYSAVWDGRNNLGSAAVSGIYFCKMEAGDWSATRKVVMLR
jgi:hypothetical protein